MFLSASLSTLLLVLSITGSPVEVRNSPITLPLIKRLNFSNATINLVQHDKARVAALRDYNIHGRHAESISTRLGFDEYIVAFGVGSPPRTYNLIVDTGSSVTWIGASTPYVPTSSSVSTGQRGAVASFSGTLFLDTVTLGGGLTITKYPLAVASTSRNVKYDGILGIGLQELTINTLENNNSPTDTYPTFTDYLVKADAIDQNLVGIFFQPITEDLDTYVGELAFGEPDYTKLTSEIIYTAVTAVLPSANYWGIDQSITYGTTDILFPTAGVVDTGSTFISIASDAYGRYRAATGATPDQATGLLRITSDQYDALQPLDFHIDNKILSLTRNAQIWPRQCIYLIITDMGRDTGYKLDFITGYTFMQRFYTVLDGYNFWIGFATTPFTDATTN
ncbi:aspartic proteinase [Suillus spraguei]|nr:aspartic proteinase [Suillus spraguei]